LLVVFIGYSWGIYLYPLWKLCSFNDFMLFYGPKIWTPWYCWESICLVYPLTVLHGGAPYICAVSYTIQGWISILSYIFSLP
jgi:hypothetical protein